MREAENRTPAETVNHRFSQFARTLDYPLYVLTTLLRGEPTGCLIGFAVQCSIHPPRFLACLSKKNHTFQLATHAAVVAVHVIDAENKVLAELFGGQTGDLVDKFERVKWHPVDGVPVLDGCNRWFTGRVIEHIDLGDHMGHLLEPITVEPGPATVQLTYQQARDIDPGHKP